MRFESAIEELKKDLLGAASEIKEDPRVTQMIKTLKALNGLEELDGVPKTALLEVLGFDVDLQSEVISKPTEPPVRFDEFVGLRTIDAAKLYLKKFKEARPFEEIVQAVSRGRGKPLSDDEVTKLNKSLLRSTFHVVQIGDRYGLLENYPNVNRVRRPRIRLRSRSTREPDEPQTDNDSNGEDETEAGEEGTEQKNKALLLTKREGLV